jgi:hypothetical protein
MDSTITKALRRAYDYVKQGNKQAAQPILVEVLKRDSEIEQAWLLLSLVVDDPKRQVYALRQVVRLNPGNEKARDRLFRLTGEEASAMPAPAERASTDDFDPVEDIPVTPTFDVPEDRLPDELDFNAAAREPSAPSFITDDELINQRLFGGEMPAPSTPKKTPPATATEAVDEVAEQIFEDFGTENGEDLPFDEQPARSEKSRPPINWRRVLTMSGVLIVLALILGMGWVAVTSGLLQMSQLAAIPGLPTETATSTATELPEPTSTPTPTNTSTPRPTITPLPSPTVAVAPLTADGLATAETIQQQVQELSALNEEVEGGLPGIINLNQARDIAAGASAGLDLRTIEKVYQYLGIMQEGQSLENYFLNLGVDPSGGMYDSNQQQVYLVGLNFDEKAQYAYVNQYMAYLIDQQAGPLNIGLQTACTETMQACAALRALITGQSTIVRDDWLRIYASAVVEEAIEASLSNNRLFPQAGDPAFTLVDLDFYSGYGTEFVKALKGKSGTAAAWEAYLAPPTTTEQIMHPDAYFDGDAGVEVDDLSIVEALMDDGWELDKSDSLGEWFTYLMLTQSANPLAQLESDDAFAAAAGWGGDRYYLLSHPSAGNEVFAIHWVWDDADEMEEFYTFLTFYLSGRFSDGFPEVVVGAECYGLDMTACLFTQDDAAVLVLGRDLASVETLMAAYITSFE